LAISNTTTANTALVPNFTDVASGHWAHGYIHTARDRGLVQGVGGNRFDPESTLTRAQVAQILFNAYAADMPANNFPFPDVNTNHWYAEAASWVVYRGIMEDMAGGNFRPHDPAPRELVADALHRISIQRSITLPTVRDAVTFTDQASITRLAAVQALQRAGVISGFPDGSFGPNRTITRAEMAAIVVRYTDLPGLMPGGVVSPDPPRPPDGMIGLPAPPTVPQLRPGAVLDYEWTLQPGDHLRDGERMVFLPAIGWDGAYVIVAEVGATGLPSHRIDIVLIGDVEANGPVVVVYADGTIVVAQREVFTNGERWFIYLDMSRRGMLFEFFAAYRVVDCGYGYGVVRRFGNERQNSIMNVSQGSASASPYQTARPDGRGSVYDIIYLRIFPDGQERWAVRTD